MIDTLIIILIININSKDSEVLAIVGKCYHCQAFKGVYGGVFATVRLITIFTVLFFIFTVINS